MAIKGGKRINGGVRSRRAIKKMHRSSRKPSSRKKESVISLEQETKMLSDQLIIAHECLRDKTEAYDCLGAEMAMVKDQLSRAKEDNEFLRELGDIRVKGMDSALTVANYVAEALATVAVAAGKLSVGDALKAFRAATEVMNIPLSDEVLEEFKRSLRHGYSAALTTEVEVLKKEEGLLKLFKSDPGFKNVPEGLLEYIFGAR